MIEQAPKLPDVSGVVTGPFMLYGMLSHSTVSAVLAVPRCCCTCQDSKNHDQYPLC